MGCNIHSNSISRIFGNFSLQFGLIYLKSELKLYVTSSISFGIAWQYWFSNIFSFFPSLHFKKISCSLFCTLYFHLYHFYPFEVIFSWKIRYHSGRLKWQYLPIGCYISSLLWSEFNFVYLEMCFISMGNFFPSFVSFSTPDIFLYYSEIYAYSLIVLLQTTLTKLTTFIPSIRPEEH